MGAHDLSLPSEDSRMECKAHKAIQHPDFNGSYHDIMLVKIKCNVRMRKRKTNFLTF